MAGFLYILEYIYVCIRFSEAGGYRYSVLTLIINQACGKSYINFRLMLACARVRNFARGNYNVNCESDGLSVRIRVVVRIVSKLSRVHIRVCIYLYIRKREHVCK